MELRDEVASKDDIGDRNNEGAADISRIVVWFGRVHSAELRDRGVERFENLDIRQRTRIHVLEMAGESENSANATGAVT